MISIIFPNDTNHDSSIGEERNIFCILNTYSPEFQNTQHVTKKTFFEKNTIKFENK